MATLNRSIKLWLEWAQKQAKSEGWSFRVTSSVRDEEAQARLYYGGKNPFPVAKPGYSQHQYGYAVDIVPTPKLDPTQSPTWTRQQYAARLVSWWRSAGGYWSDSDPVHFAFFDPQSWENWLISHRKKKTPGGSVAPVRFVVAGTVTANLSSGQFWAGPSTTDWWSQFFPDYDPLSYPYISWYGGY